MSFLGIKVKWDSKKPLNIGSGNGNSWNSMWQNVDRHSDKLDKWEQNQWDNMTGKNARIAQEKAAVASENTRRENMVKEFGARQQADSLAYAGAMSGSSGGAANNAPGLVGQGSAPGTIGSNLSSSGTF